VKNPKRMKAPPAWMVVGALVDYSAFIGAPPTILLTKIRRAPWQLDNGQWVALLEGKSGCVAIEAASERVVAHRAAGAADL
jgi:hypothetical protein